MFGSGSPVTSGVAGGVPGGVENAASRQRLAPSKSSLGISVVRCLEPGVGVECGRKRKRKEVGVYGCLAYGEGNTAFCLNGEAGRRIMCLSPTRGVMGGTKAGKGARTSSALVRFVRPATAQRRSSVMKLQELDRMAYTGVYTRGGGYHPQQYEVRLERCASHWPRYLRLRKSYPGHNRGVDTHRWARLLRRQPKLRG
jgi:hypothetical protein